MVSITYILLYAGFVLEWGVRAPGSGAWAQCTQAAMANKYRPRLPSRRKAGVSFSGLSRDVGASPSGVCSSSSARGCRRGRPPGFLLLI